MEQTAIRFTTPIGCLGIINAQTHSTPAGGIKSDSGFIWNLELLQNIATPPPGPYCFFLTSDTIVKFGRLSN